MASASERGQVHDENSPAKNRQGVNQPSSVLHADAMRSGLVPSLDNARTAGQIGLSQKAHRRLIPSLTNGDMSGATVTAWVHSEPLGTSLDFVTIIPQPECIREHDHEIPENEILKEVTIDQWAGVVNAAESLFGHFASVEDVRLRLQQVEATINLSQRGLLAQDELQVLDKENIRLFFHTLPSNATSLGREAGKYTMTSDSLSASQMQEVVASGKKVVFLEELPSGVLLPHHVGFEQDVLINEFDGQALTLDSRQKYFSFIFEEKPEDQYTSKHAKTLTVFEKTRAMQDSDQTFGKHSKQEMSEEEIAAKREESERYMEDVRRKVNKKLRGCAIRAVESAFGAVATDEETDLRLDPLEIGLEAYNNSVLNFSEAYRLDLANISLFYHILTGNDTQLGNAMSNHTLTTTFLDVKQLQEAIDDKKIVIVAGWRGEDGVGHIRHLGMDKFGFIDVGEKSRVRLNPEHHFFSFVFEERAQDDAKPNGNVFDSGGRDSAGKKGAADGTTTRQTGNDGIGEPPQRPPTEQASAGDPERRIILSDERITVELPELVARVKANMQRVADAMASGQELPHDENSLTEAEIGQYFLLLESDEMQELRREYFYNLLRDYVRPHYTPPQDRRTIIYDVACGDGDIDSVMEAYLGGGAFGSRNENVLIKGFDVSQQEIDKAIEKNSKIGLDGERILPPNYTYVKADASNLSSLPEAQDQPDLILVRHQNINHPYGVKGEENPWPKIFEQVSRLTDNGVMIVTSYQEREHQRAIEALQNIGEIVVNERNPDSAPLRYPYLNEDQFILVIKKKKQETGEGDQDVKEAVESNSGIGVRDLIDRVRRPFTVTHDDAMRAGDLLRTFVNSVTHRELQTPDAPALDQFTGLTENAYTETAIFDLGDGIHVQVQWEEGMISDIPDVSRLVIYEEIPGSADVRDICRYFSVGNGPGMRVDFDQLHHPSTEATGELTDDQARQLSIEQVDANRGFFGVAELADLENILARTPRADLAVAVEIVPEQEPDQEGLIFSVPRAEIRPENVRWEPDFSVKSASESQTKENQQVALNRIRISAQGREISVEDAKRANDMFRDKFRQLLRSNQENSITYLEADEAIVVDEFHLFLPTVDNEGLEVVLKKQTVPQTQYGDKYTIDILDGNKKFISVFTSNWFDVDVMRRDFDGEFANLTLDEFVQSILNGKNDNEITEDEVTNLFELLKQSIPMKYKVIAQ